MGFQGIDAKVHRKGASVVEMLSRMLGLDGLNLVKLFGFLPFLLMD